MVIQMIRFIKRMFPFLTGYPNRKGGILLKLQDVMSTDLEYVSTKDNLYEAACLMRDHNIGLIPVVDQGKLVGVVTDRDIVVRGVAERRPNSLEVGKVMSSTLVKGFPEMSVGEAEELMAQAQVRRLPVVDHENRLVGIVSLGDLALRARKNVTHAVSEISETHDPTSSNDLQSSSFH